jgi:hypothetical protein
MEFRRPTTHAVLKLPKTEMEIVKCLQDTASQLHNSTGARRKKLQAKFGDCQVEWNQLKHTELRLPKTIIPGTSTPIPKPTEMEFLPKPKPTDMEFLPKPKPTDMEFVHPATTEMEFRKREPTRTDFHSESLAEVRENTKPPSLKPPYNLPQESKQQKAWRDYIKKRYGTDAGRLELDRLKVDQDMYDIAKQAIRQINKQIDDFRNTINEQGNTEEEEEAIQNFGVALMKHVFGFVFDKVQGAIVASIASGFSPSDKTASEGYKFIANQFLNGVKAGIQFLANLSYTDTIRDLKRIREEMMSFNTAWKPAYNRQLKEEAEALPGGETTKLPPNKKPIEDNIF